MEDEVQQPLLAVAPHVVDKRLELILSNPNQSWAKKMGDALLFECKKLWPLAAPTVIVYMINYTMSMITRIYCGHLGNLALAASSLGNSGIQVFAYGLMSWAKNVRDAVLWESKKLWQLAVPTVIVYTINYIMSMSTQMFCGHLGNLQLAASSLGNTGIQVFAYGVMTLGGLLSFQYSQ